MKVEKCQSIEYGNKSRFAQDMGMSDGTSVGTYLKVVEFAPETRKPLIGRQIQDELASQGGYRPTTPVFFDQMAGQTRALRPTDVLEVDGKGDGRVEEGYGGVESSADLPGGQGIRPWQQDLGWTLYNNPIKDYGLLGRLASGVGGALLDNQIENIDESFAALDGGDLTAYRSTIDEPTVSISDAAGNVRNVAQSQAEALQDLARNDDSNGGWQSDFIWISW